WDEQVAQQRLQHVQQLGGVGQLALLDRQFQSRPVDELQHQVASHLPRPVGLPAGGEGLLDVRQLSAKEVARLEIDRGGGGVGEELDGDVGTTVPEGVGNAGIGAEDGGGVEAV